jgi:hypothetical protein
VVDRTSSAAGVVLILAGGNLACVWVWSWNLVFSRRFVIGETAFVESEVLVVVNGGSGCV